MNYLTVNALSRLIHTQQLELDGIYKRRNHTPKGIISPSDISFCQAKRWRYLVRYKCINIIFILQEYIDNFIATKVISLIISYLCVMYRWLL